MRPSFLNRSNLDGLPDHALLSIVQIPSSEMATPWKMFLRRIIYALILLMLATLVVYLDRTGYSQPNMSFLDALYYSTVTLTTTGYGDITPVTELARLINVIVIFPVRVAFLILLVGTTLSVLTEETRRTIQLQRWRKKMKDHTVVIGYGTKGRSAVAAMLDDGMLPNQIVVVDTDPAALDAAARHGLATVAGSGTKTDVLRLAGVSVAKSIIVAPNSDDTAVLTTLSAREIAPNAMIVASVRESENAHLLSQSGADSVVVSAETAGRMLGLATATPMVVELMEDLLSPDVGFSITQRVVHDDEVGADPHTLPDIVLGIVRGGHLHRVGTAGAQRIQRQDRLLTVKLAQNQVSPAMTIAEARAHLPHQK